MPTWDELFKQEEFQWKEPHERVVDLVPILKERGFHRVCDLGCGTGRHLVCLTRAGFEVYGSDISETALEYSRTWLQREGLRAELNQADMTLIPYPDALFDAVISLYVIYHNTLANIKKTVAEIHRVLRPGGLALLTFMSNRGYRYSRGRQLEPDTFVPDVGVDSGIPHHFSDRGEIESLLSAFHLLKIDLDEWVDDQGQRHSHWQVLMEK
jgi:SAM-dependent methyltransferase